MSLNVSDMLAGYRAAAQPALQAIAAEFMDMSPSQQRELLFWMLIETITNPTRIQHANPGSNGPAAGTA